MRVGMHDAKADLSELVPVAESGEHVVLTRNGKAAVQLVALRPSFPPVRLGALQGEIELGADFDAPRPGFGAFGRRRA